MTYGKLKNFAQGGMMAPTRSPVRFCQSPTDDYLETSLHSPTDSSEDSVEVKVTPITSLRNKRKCAEPRKVADTFTGPLKKRMCLKVKAENSESHPFRPWSPKTADSPVDIKPAFSYPLPFVVPRVPHYHSDTHGYFRPPSPVKVPVEEQPLPLVAKRESKEEEVIVKKERESPDLISETSNDAPRVPVHPLASSMSPAETERFIVNSATNFPNLHSARKGGEGSKREQRNYKNMTRERRIEANARERTRVHTISAAFDTLRRSVPAYSHNQKLSKLSVLRIACAYIKTLSSIVTDDEAGTSQAVSLVTATIQREGKLRKKKDDSD